MPRPDASRGRTGRPPVTSRAEILAAARRVIERDGWEKLTVRRLAAEIGIGTTTLYHHVRDREDLLVQLLNEHVERTVDLDTGGEPRDRIVAAAGSIHDSLATWPRAAEILTVDGFLGRLGGPALQVVETIVDAAIACGCTPAQAVGLFRSIWYYTVGEILVRAHSTHRRTGDEEAARRETFLSGLDPDRLPRLAAIGGRWPELAARDTYTEGLEAFVGGLLAQVAERGRARY